MSTAKLIKWGNSIGIRIPAAIIKQAHLKSGEVLDISINKEGGLTLIPRKNAQENWTEQFNRIADSEQDELIEFNNDFDEDEWTW
ncbi:MAG: AbrB/MazE/SpoVT family DNA-binding domain-containing protein [Legionellaceae bacterium]|nr:AbrB/MazE/SpoVT family DNA-binding domain-containing protein [Legionellaceae bacterium]